MTRAGIFIGVDKVGDLQTLRDAAAGAKRMHEWALAQGMRDGTHAKLVTDAGGKKVRPDDVADAIAEICNGAGVDQLIVYFAGHGINLQRGDRWLLSEFPVKSHAAINVKGSVELAERCGIPHVVLIADACRVAPEGIQQQNVQGVEIFPNTEGGDAARPVDRFFACYLGRTAAEVRAGNAVTDLYVALYTDALLDALSGTRSEVLERGEGNDAAQYVRPWSLHDYLSAEIPRRVKAQGLENKVNQNPESTITSRNAWIARFDRLVASTRGAGAPPPVLAGPPPPTLRTVTRDMIASILESPGADGRRTLTDAVAARVPGAEALAAAIDHIAQPFGPHHFESQCGIKVRGARIDRFVAPFAQGQVLDDQRSLLRVDAVDGPAASVLLRLDNGTGCVIPALPGFIAALTFENGELTQVAYEPSDNSWRWDPYRERVSEVRALRALAASASRHGRFRIDPRQAEHVGRGMQYAKGIDPTLALYAAYAYHDAQLTDRIRAMSQYLVDDIGATFFDLELLGKRLMRRAIDHRQNIVPFVPMLSQGWALLTAHRVKLHATLERIEDHLRESLWTQFDAGGVDLLERAMASGELR